PAGAVDLDRAGAAHDRGVQGVRHHLRDDPRRAGQQHPDHLVLRLHDGVLRPAVRAGVRAVLPHRPGDPRADHRLPARAAPIGDEPAVTTRPATSRVRHPLSKARRRYLAIVYTGAAIVSVAVLAPVVWMVMASVTPQRILISRPLQWIPDELDWSRYREIFQ